jgi:hypothetical protein
MDLYVLLYGLSKKKMKPIMTDAKHKCENYMKARENSRLAGHHKIEIAPAGAVVWRQKSASIGDKRTGGWISKQHGFQPHT